jgi:Leucine-rich repeat (LRR) protein
METAEKIVRVWKEVGTNDIELDLRGLGLFRHPEIPNGVKYLYLNGNNISGLFLPDSIEVLDVSMNTIRFIHHLPKNLREFYAENNSITEIVSFPDNLEYIRLCTNNLRRLPNIPNSLKSLYVSNNLLTKIPSLPDSLTHMDISYNNVYDLPILPSKLKYLWTHSNRLRYIPSDLPSSLLGCTISFKNPLPEYMQQSLHRIHIRKSDIDIYRKKLHCGEMIRCREKCNTIREELMKATWNPETKIGRYLISKEVELDD